MNKELSLTDKYYLLIEPEERKRYLQKELEELGHICADEKITLPDRTSYLLREQLFDIRYEMHEHKGSHEYVDRFLQLWMELSFETENSYSERKKRKAFQKISAMIDKMGLSDYRNMGDEALQALYDEMRHLVRTYIYSSENSRSYTKFFDLIPISKNRVHSKINNDIERVFIDYPLSIGIYEIFPGLIDAAKDELEYYNRKSQSKQTFFE